MSTRIPGSRSARRGKRFSPRKSPVQERARATIEAVLAAAAQVFEARGFAAGTTNRIAERAGVSVGTLYQYFPGKEAIAVALVERHMAEMMRGLAGWEARAGRPGTGLREALELLVDTAVAAHEVQPRLHHVLLEEAMLPPGVHDAVRRAEREAARRIAAVLGRIPGVRRPDLERAAAIAVQIALGLTHRFAAEGAARPARGAFVSEVVDVLEAYLASG